ncbi:peptidoglycan-binding domain-containing protein [Streptomyces sp. NPDC048357]|uniref:peptidoglycan-binding domain-containing protein n=1 Tax=Streptomyces sp. NPDC048357 TaxID=3154719 RepID=UPI00342A047D
MSQEPHESGLVPDDHLLVRPYVGPSGSPPRPTAPAWPQTGPLAFPGPAAPQAAGPAPAAAPAVAPARVRDAADGESRSSRLPLAVGTLLALAGVGAVVLLLSGPEPEPPRAGRPPELSVPVLPARSPDAGVGGKPGPDASARAGASSAAPTAGPSESTGAKASGGPESTRSPNASAPRPSGAGASVTLRMGDTGPEVRALQEMLYGQGFTYVSVTGVFDGQTKRGVGQLQRDRSIEGDPQGVYGPATQAAMR